MRTFLNVLLAAAALGTATSSFAQTETECCLRGTSASYAGVHSIGQEADEKFFTVKGAPPNMMVLLDTSGSMKDLPVPPWVASTSPETARCKNPVYDAIIKAGAFDMSKSYPPSDLGVAPCPAPGCWTGDKGFPDLFKELSFYRYRDWTDSTATARTADDACSYTSSPYECRLCVTRTGYYIDPDAPWRGAYAGKFLNFYAPKFVTARTAIKKVIWNIKQVRMGVSVFDAPVGAKMISKLNPPCDKSLDPEDASWDNNRKSLINEMNNTSKVFFAGGTPLAEALLNVGQYFTSDSTVYDDAFGTGWTKAGFENGALTSENRSICYGCQISSIVVVTDGAPCTDNCMPECIKRQGATCVGCDQKDCGCYGLCPNKCGGGSDCKSAGSENCCGGSSNYLDDIAKWIWETDLQTKEPGNGKWSAKGKQRAATYTVGFGLDHPLLANTATVGGGQYYTANDRTSLENALKAIVDNVNQRATAFGVSSISTLQTSSGMSTIVPRFVPGKTGEAWRGYLNRFGLGNELANGCVASDPPDAKDLNGDGDCKDVFYLDLDGDIVEEDPITGMFVKLGTTTPAKPLWEAGAEMKWNNPTYATPETAPLRDPDDRVIWTVIDNVGTDNRIDAADNMIEFSAANATTLMGSMGISASILKDEQCKTIMQAWGYVPGATPETPVPPGYSSWGHACASAVIDFYRGERSTHPDPLLRDTPRDWLLGDIFHSSPVVVEPPISEAACPFFSGQCVASIYSYAGKIDKGAQSAYKDYVESVSGPCGGSVPCERRPSLVVVGSNRGFLHAFQGGEVVTPDERDAFTGRLRYNDGTGEEVWAFAPPDLLGKMKYYVTNERHGYFVDGTAMVRDVWVDGDTLALGNGVKEPNEFRSIAVIGERSGGQHFFALDLTLNGNTQTKPKPKFLWMWPQPCDVRVQDMGETWSNFFPKPPPIIPVLLDTTTTGYSAGFPFQFRRYDASTNTWSDQTATAQERWVVGLNGGYDRVYNRGRGFALVDVWTGKPLWEEFYRDNGTDAQKRLEYPIAAGLAFLDIGPGEVGNPDFFDGYFDTFTVGDLGGNFWTGRMYEPGKLTNGQVTNWAFARSFETERASDSMKDRRPISFISSNAVQPSTGYIRSFFGTGSRAALLDRNGGSCSLDEVSACIEMGCKVDSKYKAKNIPSGETEVHFKWENHQLKEKKTAIKACVDSACLDKLEALCNANCTATTCTGLAPCPTCAGEDACVDAGRTACAGPCTGVCKENKLELDVKIESCPTLTTVGPTLLEREVEMVCKQPNVTDPLECKVKTDKNSTGVIKYKASPAAVVEHRFFGVHIFGAGNPTRVFSDAAGATAYDAQRLTETDLTYLGTLSTPTDNVATQAGSGWYLNYDHIDERTASPAGIVPARNLESGCVLWNTMTPQSSSTVCAASGSQLAHLIQADFVTGASDCAQGFDSSIAGSGGAGAPGGANPLPRFLSRAVIAPPSEPTAVIMTGGGGAGGGGTCGNADSLQYGVINAEPGSNPNATLTASDNDLVQSVYQLELNGPEHMCRHRGGACGQ